MIVATLDNLRIEWDGRRFWFRGMANGDQGASEDEVLSAILKHDYEPTADGLAVLGWQRPGP